jgi:hypothetical protein
MRTLTRTMLAVLAMSMMASCASNPHKAKKIDTKLEKSEEVAEDQSIGVKDGNMVYQRKVRMAEELRKLQYDVYEQEDRVYGNRKYGSQGIYGSLRSCRAEVSDPKWGGDGKLKWTEPIERVTDKEEQFEIGIDENDKIVGVSEEFLKDRIKRFQEYRRILNGREDDLREKLEICKAELRAAKSRKEAAAQEPAGNI